KEALIWQYLDHPNIVDFFGIDHLTFPGKRAMVSEWMAEGNLLEYMQKRPKVSEYALNDVASGLAYLHTENVVHGDLCCRNILVNEKGHACLTDFGLTAFIESDTSVKSSASRSGSPHWMAPELWHPEEFGMTKFRRTPASDIYAYACVCCEVWSEGSPPFPNIAAPTSIMFEVLEGKRTERPSNNQGVVMPDSLWQLTQLCWAQQPHERLCM
ncbi:kinase-like protein, partial [Rhodocollybia butyracea]